MLVRQVSRYAAQVKHRGASGAHRGEHAREFLASLPIRSFVTRDYPVLKSAVSLDEARRTVGMVARHCFPVVDAGGKARGVLSFTHLRALIASGSVVDESASLETLPLEPADTIDIRDTMLDAALLLASSTVDLLIVTAAAAGGRMEGVIPRHAFVEAHAREVAALDAAARSEEPVPVSA